MLSHRLLLPVCLGRADPTWQRLTAKEKVCMQTSGQPSRASSLPSLCHRSFLSTTAFFLHLAPLARHQKRAQRLQVERDGHSRGEQGLCPPARVSCRFLLVLCTELLSFSCDASISPPLLSLHRSPDAFPTQGRQAVPAVCQPGGGARHCRRLHVPGHTTLLRPSSRQGRTTLRRRAGRACWQEQRHHRRPHLFYVRG